MVFYKQFAIFSFNKSIKGELIFAISNTVSIRLIQITIIALVPFLNRQFLIRLILGEEKCIFISLSFLVKISYVHLLNHYFS